MIADAMAVPAAVEINLQMAPWSWWQLLMIQSPGRQWLTGQLKVMSPHSPSKRWRKRLYVHSWRWALGSGPGKLPSDTTLCNECSLMRKTPPNSSDWVQLWGILCQARRRVSETEVRGLTDGSHGSQSPRASASAPHWGADRNRERSDVLCSTGHSASFQFQDSFLLVNWET